MPSLLIGTSYTVSVGLIIFAIQSNLAPAEWKFPLVMIWAIAGLLLAVLAIIWPRRTAKSE